MVSAFITSSSKDRQIQHLTSEVVYRTRLQAICNRINAAGNLDEILIDLKNEIISLFAADRVRHDSSVASASKSIASCTSLSTTVLLLDRLLLLPMILGSGTYLVIDEGAKPLAKKEFLCWMQANEKTRTARL